MSNRQPHHGKNLKRVREYMHVSQDTLASELGEDWDQKKVSRLEEKDIIPDDLMEQIAKILKVPAEAIKNFDEERIIQIISNTFNDHSVGYAGVNAPTFNPLDKLVEVYEALVKSEREKVALLERLLNEKK